MDEENKKLKIGIVAGIVLAVLLAGWLCRPAYRHFKERRSAAQAQVFFNKGDYRNAWLSALRALQMNSNNVPACRIVAQVSDLDHNPFTLDRWQRVVTLSPTTDNKLALADTGLRYQDPPYPLTAQVLEALSNSAAGAPAFHIVSAELALAMHRMTEAENQFAAVCELDPTNRRFQLNLAVIRLGSTNAAAATEARAQLKQFCSDTNLGPAALRSLISDRLMHDDPRAALDYSAQVLVAPWANLGDRLKNLDILKRLQSPELAGRLKSLQASSATNAVMTAQTARWMDANGFRAEAIDWLNHLPAATASQPPARIALAECYLAGGDWTALRGFVAKDNSWGEMDFLRFAFLSRAWNKLGETVVADGNWQSAVSLAGDRLGALNNLLELAGQWGMSREQEDLLRRIVRRFPDAVWARRGLEQIYLAAGNTRALYQFCAEQLPLSPQNVELKNNLAATALLLKTNLPQAFQWAAEAYAGRTNDPSIVSTYAYALHLQGHDKDGLAALQKMKPSQLEQPSVALYYGVLLRAAGQTGEAATYLGIARTNGQLLPEEKQLLVDTVK